MGKLVKVMNNILIYFGYFLLIPFMFLLAIQISNWNNEGASDISSSLANIFILSLMVYISRTLSIHNFGSKREKIALKLYKIITTLIISFLIVGIIVIGFFVLIFHLPQSL